ncbi:tetratricopeptide repeat protein 17-like [Oppia nitens]|uniref:tetratricopeptide repeat protein 17-like n=1 Tax=Oppia nitens TaxID=1686743 RepID=UPI0023DBBE30|nr:tetratricopeptide repeat protein 17-like [Oppia nitens]
MSTNSYKVSAASAAAAGHRIAGFNRLILWYLLIIIHASKAATHWVVTEDGKLQTQDDSVYQLRRPYDLMSLLHQERRADMLATIKNQLIAQKEEIESDTNTSSDDTEDDVEQLVYSTNTNCAEAGKPLTQFDLYIGSMLFYVPNDDNVVNYCIVAVDSRPEKHEPNCSQIMPMDFSMSSFEHLPSIRDRKSLVIEPEYDIHTTITNLDDIEDYGDAVYEALKQNTSSWLLYTMASFYWRAVGNAAESVDCLRRAIHLTPYQYRHIPLVSLGNVLHRSKSSEEAAIVIHAAIDVAPDTTISHYTLGNIYAVMADYNKSIICFDNVLKLDPDFEEAKLRKYAVLCHNKVEKALKAQHDTLQKTLEELQGYQKQQELWLQYQQKLLSEQAPPGTILEQRLHYREYKIREIIDQSNRGVIGNNKNGAGGQVLHANGGSGGGGSGASITGNSVAASVNSNSLAESAAAAAAACLTVESSTGAQKGNTADCHMVPILIPITFVPPS